MNLPTEDDRATSGSVTTWLAWGFIAVVIIAGVVLALLYGPRIASVLDSLT